jgi:transcriptional regulator with XRE-family HTH domain
VGVAQVTVSHWEQGLKFPQRGTRYRVAQRLGIHPSQIVWETGKTNANTTANDERPTAR